MNGLPAEDKETKRKIILSISVILFFVIGIIAGCAVRNPDVEPGEPAPVAKLEGKKIAVLPVCSDKSIATSSQLQLQKKVNRELAKKIKNFLPSAKIMDSIETTNKLNRQNKLKMIDELVDSFRSMGTFDTRVLKSIAGILGSEYIVASTLKKENVDAVVGSIYAISLDITFVDRNNNIVWSGTGDFKQTGIFGAGRVNSSQASKEVTNLAFAYWQ